MFFIVILTLTYLIGIRLQFKGEKKSTQHKRTSKVSYLKCQLANEVCYLLSLLLPSIIYYYYLKVYNTFCSFICFLFLHLLFVPSFVFCSFFYILFLLLLFVTLVTFYYSCYFLLLPITSNYSFTFYYFLFLFFTF
jgi:hypothetical protein